MNFVVTILLSYFGKAWKKAAGYITLVLLLVVAIYGLVWYGQSIEGEKQVVKELKVYRNVREKIDETPASPDVSSAVERLRESGDVRKR
tara:strand:- start:203 stop:469 length:267 start_codon:yes stop_codon:yes gene_type:complete